MHQLHVTLTQRIKLKALKFVKMRFLKFYNTNSKNCKWNIDLFNDFKLKVHPKPKSEVKM